MWHIIYNDSAERTRHLSHRRRVRSLVVEELSYNSVMAYFDLPLNLPHAGRIAARIGKIIESRALGLDLRYFQLSETVENLETLLVPFSITDTDPHPERAEPVRQEAANLGRELVDQIVRLELGEDRLGQCVRNLFECLAMGEEGAELSLRAGENPRSLQRPG